jgi:ATP-binding cassette subfamily G (WHITE) protein 2 (SNQ2)
MPAPLNPHPKQSSSFVSPETHSDDTPRVQVSHGDEDALADIHRTLTEKSLVDPKYPEPHSSFDKFLEEQVRDKKPANLGVCFQSLSTWGEGDSHADIKTLGTALWRTFTLQDIYEWTIQPWLTEKKPEDGRPLIRDFSGVVDSGEIML